MGPKVITMDSSGVNTAYAVRNWAIKKKIRLFYNVIHEPKMAPVEKVFSEVKESMVHIVCVDEKKIMEHVRSAFERLDKDYWEKIFFSSYKFCFGKVQEIANRPQN
jgi:hypothetical protein